MWRYWHLTRVCRLKVTETVQHMTLGTPTQIGAEEQSGNY